MIVDVGLRRSGGNAIVTAALSVLRKYGTAIYSLIAINLLYLYVVINNFKVLNR
jgi:hypothetical protein